MKIAWFAKCMKHSNVYIVAGEQRVAVRRGSKKWLRSLTLKQISFHAA